jgi:hypothetical protein
VSAGLKPAETICENNLPRLDGNCHYDRKAEIERPRQLSNRPVSHMNKISKEQRQLLLMGACLFFAALILCLHGVYAWRNFEYLNKDGIEVEGRIVDIARKQRSSKTVSLTFDTEAGKAIEARCLVTSQYYYKRLARADLATTTVRVRYSKTSPENFLIVEGTDPEVDAAFCFAGALCFLAAFVVFPLPKDHDQRESLLPRVTLK